MAMKSLTILKSYSQSQSKWPHNHDLKSFACNHDFVWIGSVKSRKDWWRFQIFNQIIYRTHFYMQGWENSSKWNFLIFKIDEKVFLVSQENNWFQWFLKIWCISNQILDWEWPIPINFVMIGIFPLSHSCCDWEWKILKSDLIPNSEHYFWTHNH